MNTSGLKHLVVYAVGRTGLGQTVRALRLVDHVIGGGGKVTATVITGILEAQSLFAPQPGVVIISPRETVLLVEKARNGASHDQIQDAVRSATDRLFALTQALSPDVFVTTSHRGVAGELIPILHDLRGKGCRCVLALRDIYQPSGYEQDFAALTRDDFQHVVIAGPPAISQWLPRGLLLGPLKPVVTFEGYLRPPGLRSTIATNRTDGDLQVVCQVGGGRDGRILLEKAMTLVENLRASKFGQAKLFASAGPLMSLTDLDAMRLAAHGTADIQTWWVQAPIGTQVRPDLVLSMAGYNSCVEAAVTGVPTVLVPRLDPADREQEIRARLFDKWFQNVRTVESGSAAQLLANGIELLTIGIRDRAPTFGLPGDMFAVAERVMAAVLGSGPYRDVWSR